MKHAVRIIITSLVEKGADAFDRDIVDRSDPSVRRKLAADLDQVDNELRALASEAWRMRRKLQGAFE